LLKSKSSRNNRNLPLPSIGVAKLKQLLDLGVSNALDLLRFEDVIGVFYSRRTHNAKLNSWKAEADQYFQKKKQCLKDLAKVLAAKKAEYKAADQWHGIEDALAPVTEEDSGEEDVVSEEAPASLPLLFSSMTDPCGYNARFLSSSQVNCKQETESRHCKPMQDAKMMGLSGEILKIDWPYKVAGKIYVYQGPGQCFKPFTNMLNVQNEDGLTIAWKCTEGGESLDPIRGDLLRLKRWNTRLNTTTKGIYIDVCCKYRQGLKRIFGQHVWVKLDVFHWMRRWDSILVNSKLEKGAIFRTSMSRAVFLTTSDEYEQAQRRLIDRRVKKDPNDKEWRPTVRQIMKEGNSMIPEPVILQQRVMALIRYCKFCDAETDILIASRPEGCEDPLPLCFFKKSMEAENIVQEQMSHVVKGCLSDPSDLSVHQRNPKTGLFYCRRGTSSIESDHRGLDQLMGNHVGIGLCDQKASTYFELLNEKKRINRLGGDDYGTHRTESLAILNSLPSSCGYEDKALPFPDLSVPALPPLNDREYFGVERTVMSQCEFASRYSTSLQPAINTVENEEAITIDTEADIDSEDAAPASVLADLDAEDTAEENDVNKTVSDVTEEEEDRAVEAVVARIAPLIKPNETTAQAYERLTNRQAWYPFHRGNTPPTEIHKEEFVVFDEMESRFK